MLPQRPKMPVGQTNQIKMSSHRPFSILSLGLIGQQKPKISNKVKNNNEKKVAVKEKRITVNDQNHNYSNYISEKSNNIDLKCKDLGDTVFQKVQMSSNNFDTTSWNLDNRKEYEQENKIFFKPSNILLNEITNQMIEESQEKLIIKKQDNVCKSESVSKNMVAVVNLSKKIKKVEKPKHFFKTFELQEDDISSKMEEQSLPKTEREQIAFDHAQLLKNAYSDREVIVDASIFRYKIINQRIDNDVESDDEQINSGIRRLQNWLEDAVELNKKSSDSRQQTIF